MDGKRRNEIGEVDHEDVGWMEGCFGATDVLYITVWNSSHTYIHIFSLYQQSASPRTLLCFFPPTHAIIPEVNPERL